jgi:hypothetical protein
MGFGMAILIGSTVRFSGVKGTGHKGESVPGWVSNGKKVFLEVCTGVVLGIKGRVYVCVCPNDALGESKPGAGGGFLVRSLAFNIRQPKRFLLSVTLVPPQDCFSSTPCNPLFVSSLRARTHRFDHTDGTEDAVAWQNGRVCKRIGGK